MRSCDLNAKAFELARALNVTFAQAKRVLGARGGRSRAAKRRAEQAAARWAAEARQREGRISP